MTSGKSGIGRRRVVLGLGAATALAAPAIRSAGAQGAWPNKAVKLVVPYAPGGASDTMARPWADKLTQAVAIACIPEDIRGYGHVKERHLKAAKQKEATLIAAYNAPAPASAGSRSNVA